jgi:steroid delta-isomerase-like uncharacterized protein
MSTQENKAIARRLLEDIWNNGSLNVVDEIFTTNFVRHGPVLEGEVSGREAVKKLVTMFRNAFPDLRTSAEDQVAEGNLVVTRWTARGTHRGELMGIAPSGKQIRIAGALIDRLAGGKIEAEWAYYDAMDMMKQLGVAAPGGRG